MPLWLRRALLAFGWCEPTAHDVPGVRPIDAAWVYDHYRWEWRELAAALVNAGRHLECDDFPSVRWFVCDEIPTEWASRLYSPAILAPSASIVGLWLRNGNAIVLTRRSMGRLDAVRHLMTFAMCQRGGLDAEWFQPRFRNVLGD